MTPHETESKLLDVSISLCALYRHTCWPSANTHLSTEQVSAHLETIQFVPENLSVLAPINGAGPLQLRYIIQHVAKDVYKNLEKNCDKIPSPELIPSIKTSAALWNAMAYHQAMLASDLIGHNSENFGAAVADILPYRDALTEAQAKLINSFIDIIFISEIPETKEERDRAWHRAEGFGLQATGVPQEFVTKSAAITALCYTEVANLRAHRLSHVIDALKHKEHLSPEYVNSLKALYAQIFPQQTAYTTRFPCCE